MAGYHSYSVMLFVSLGGLVQLAVCICIDVMIEWQVLDAQ